MYNHFNDVWTVCVCVEGGAKHSCIFMDPRLRTTNLQLPGPCQLEIPENSFIFSCCTTNLGNSQIHIFS